MGFGERSIQERASPALTPSKLELQFNPMVEPEVQ